MKGAYKAFLLIGAIFSFVGIIITTAFFANREVFGWFCLFPLIFLFMGIAFIILPIRQIRRNKMIIKNGRRISAKIYDYCEDTSATVNGAFPVNTVCQQMPVLRKTHKRLIQCILRS